MKNKKSFIDTYETIYPVHLVVANENVTLEQLKELYCYADDKELDDSIMNAVCTTSRCKRKDDDRNISLVKFNHPTRVKNIDIKADMINTYAHEATHVALDIYDFIREQISVDYQEQLAYLIAWIAECIYKTLSKK